MEIRKLNIARGWIWVKQGYQLIMRNPLMSVIFSLICAFAMIAVIGIPFLGPLIAVVMIPTVLTGYMRICRALEEEEEVELPQLVEGFRKHAARLMALGSITLLGLLVASSLMMLIGGEALTAVLEKFHSSSDPQVLTEAIQAAGAGVAFSLLVGFTLAFVLMLALQYAPMLIFFNNLSPFAALRASLEGSLRNIAPYAVYSIIMQALAMVLSWLPYGIGMIVLLPLGLSSLYVSYRNIFPFEHELAAIERGTHQPE